MWVLICIRQFLVLSPLLAIFDMFLETNTEFMEEVAMVVKRKMVEFENFCHSFNCLLSGHKRSDVSFYYIGKTAMETMFPPPHAGQEVEQVQGLQGGRGRA